MTINKNNQILHRNNHFFYWYALLLCIVLCVPFNLSAQESASATQSHKLTRKNLIKAVQTHLNLRGYPVGQADGISGKKTVTAIQHFQKDHHLTQDGIISETLLDQLKTTHTNIKTPPKQIPKIPDNVISELKASVMAELKAALTKEIKAELLAELNPSIEQKIKAATKLIQTQPTPATAQYPDDIQAIIDRGVLRVGMYYYDTPPFYFKDKNGDLTGIDVYLIKGFARQLGVKVTFDRNGKTFNEVVNKVANKSVDLAISKISITFPRAMRVRFTKPYIILHQGLLINRLELAEQSDGRSVEETIQHLKGKIGVIERSSYVEYAQERFKKMTIVGYPSWKKVVEAATDGEVVAAYRDEAEIKKIIRDTPDTALRFLTVVLKDATDFKSVLVHSDNIQLRSLVDYYFDSLGLELTANKVLDHYDEVIKIIEEKTK